MVYFVDFPVFRCQSWWTLMVYVVDVLVFRCQGREKIEQELMTLLSNPLHTLLPPTVHFDEFVKVCGLMTGYPFGVGGGGGGGDLNLSPTQLAG